MDPTVVVEVKRFASTGEIVVVRRPVRRADAAPVPTGEPRLS